jgi:cell division FtsZ-interacting protein ZapD
MNRIIDIIESSDPDVLHLRESFDRLAAFRPLLAKIDVQERADENSALLSEYDQQRDTCSISYTPSQRHLSGRR